MTDTDTITLTRAQYEALLAEKETLEARIFNLMFYIPTFQRPSASLFIGARAR